MCGLTRKSGQGSLLDSLHLLEMARVVYRVRHSAGNGVPLGAEAKERDFKPLFLDTGLVSTSLGLSLPGLEVVDELHGDPWPLTRGGHGPVQRRSHYHTDRSVQANNLHIGKKSWQYPSVH
jgi:hypothetical protein